MILAIAYNHKDCHQAIRLLSWVAFLSEQAHGSMKGDTVLLVPSRHAAQKKVHEEAQELRGYFGKLKVHIPASEHEVGWPGAANFMFKEALHYCEMAGEEMFWLEPDAIPLHPQWWETIKDEYREAGKAFMGGEVLTGWRHMSGIGVYSSIARTVAPSLVNVPDNSSWDLHAVAEMIPHVHFTPLIQHINKTSPVKDLSILDPNAVVFHADKQGRLIELLSRQYGEDVHAIFSRMIDTPPEEPLMSTRYFFTTNASKIIESQGQQFAFDPIGSHAGVQRGVYITDKESEIIALAELSNNPSSPVKEITVERYGELVKKKLPKSRSSQPSVNVPQVIKKADPAERVANPVRSVKPLIVETPKINIAASVEEVLKIDTVKPFEPISARINIRPRHKSSRR